MFKFLNKNKKYLFIVSGFLIALGIYFCINILSGKAVDSGDRIHFVSSKEGDGIIIESNGHCGLVDALDPASYNSVSNSNTCDLTPTDTSSLGNGSTLKTYAENIGCDHFDFVIIVIYDFVFDVWFRFFFCFFCFASKDIAVNYRISYI